MLALLAHISTRFGFLQMLEWGLFSLIASRNSAVSWIQEWKGYLPNESEDIDLCEDEMKRVSRNPRSS